MIALNERILILSFLVVRFNAYLIGYKIFGLI